MNYLNAILTKLIGQRDIETSDLAVYLNSPVAIGEHSNIGEEIENKISNIDSLNSKIETINKLIKQLNRKGVSCSEERTELIRPTGSTLLWDRLQEESIFSSMGHPLAKTAIKSFFLWSIGKDSNSDTGKL